MNRIGRVRTSSHTPSVARRSGAARHPAPARERRPRAEHEPRRATIGCVIPCHNYARFVGAAIESALAQSDPYDAIVVVDDGSTDDSADVLARYADRIDIVTQANRGLLGACLAGIDRLDTDYVHVLDADDLAAPTLVERCRPLLVEQPVKLQFQVGAVDASGMPNASVFPSFAPGYDTAAMREDNRVIGLYQCPPTSGNVFHVQTLRNLGLEREDPRLPLDGAGCAVMPYLGEVVTLPEVLASYRLHGASMSNADLPPSVEVVEKELAAFETNWAAASRLLGQPEPPFADQVPLYVLERRQLVRALAGASPKPRETATYLRRLGQSHLPGWQRAVQGTWMCTLLLPSRRFRRRLVELRRSGSNRPQWVRDVISRIRD